LWHYIEHEHVLNQIPREDYEVKKQQRKNPRERL
jgi:hypothetical protein